MGGGVDGGELDARGADSARWRGTWRGGRSSCWPAGPFRIRYEPSHAMPIAPCPAGPLARAPNGDDPRLIDPVLGCLAAGLGAGLASVEGVCGGETLGGRGDWACCRGLQELIGENSTFDSCLCVPGVHTQVVQILGNSAAAEFSEWLDACGIPSAPGALGCLPVERDMEPHGDMFGSGALLRYGEDGFNTLDKCSDIEPPCSSWFSWFCSGCASARCEEYPLHVCARTCLKC